MILQLQSKFENLFDAENAEHMQKYMRNQFPFYGIQSKPRKEAERSFITKAKKEKQIDWDQLALAWNDEHREMQYFVCDYLLAMQKYLSYEDLNKIEPFVRSKQWWDTIDSLMKVYGKVGLRDSRVDDLMLKWSTDPDYWVRRVAIEHQLLRKDKMNTELLSKIIKNNLNSDEFFINKAIGWILRDYSKTNPEWVTNFIAENKSGLSKLSIREGSKYLN